MQGVCADAVTIDFARFSELEREQIGLARQAPNAKTYQRRKNSFDDVLQRSSMRAGRRSLIVAPFNAGINRGRALVYDAAAWGLALSPAIAARAAFASATVASDPARVHSTIFDGESSRNALRANGSTINSSAQPARRHAMVTPPCGVTVISSGVRSFRHAWTSTARARSRASKSTPG